MTLNEAERHELIIHRKEKTENLYTEAMFLYNAKLYNTAVNRIYYGMYHLVSALALKDNFTTSKHQQLIGWFNQNYVKENRVGTIIGRYLMRAFELRSKGDYDDFIKYTEPEVKELLANMRDFIDQVSRLL